MTRGDIEGFGTSLKRVKIHVGSMGFAMWDHTGIGELYKDETALSALILGQVGKEPNKSVFSLPPRGLSKSSIGPAPLPFRKLNSGGVCG
jgi:hypothetical protein